MRSKTIIETDYSKKQRKRAIETFNGQQIKGKGGMILTTGPDVESHIKDYKHILFEKSPFIIVEKDKEVFKEIVYKVIALKQYYDINFDLHCEDFFKVLRSLKGRIRPLRYLHFDVTRTAVKLAEDKLIDNLRWLSKSKIVKNKFYFDITGSCRHDKGKNYKLLVEEVIPRIFEKKGFEVMSCHRPGFSRYKHLHTYRDGCPMWTALYKLSKLSN